MLSLSSRLQCRLVALTEEGDGVAEDELLDLAGGKPRLRNSITTLGVLNGLHEPTGQQIDSINVSRLMFL